MIDGRRKRDHGGLDDNMDNFLSPHSPRSHSHSINYYVGWGGFVEFYLPGARLSQKIIPSPHKTCGRTYHETQKRIPQMKQI